MFFCIENLIKTTKISTEVYLIPNAQYFKLRSDLLFNFDSQMTISTNLPDEFDFIIDQFSNKINNYNTDFDIQIKRYKTLESFAKHKKIIKECIQAFPNSDIEIIMKNELKIQQGYVLLTKDSKVIIEADSPHGIYYGIQTLLQLINSTLDKHSINDVIIIDFPLLEIRGVSDDISRGQVATI